MAGGQSPFRVRRNESWIRRLRSNATRGRWLALLGPTLALPRAEAIGDEIAPRRAAHLLLHRLLEAGEPRLGHADRDVVLQIGPARALALPLLPAGAPKPELEG